MNELLGRMRVVWDGLASRERILVGAAGGILTALLLGLGLVMPVLGATERAIEEADQAEQQLGMMLRMRRDWDGLHARLAGAEERIQSSGPGQNILTLLESLAVQAGVKPSSMQKRQSGESERYQETKIEVDLKSVTLQQAVQYLASIERSPQPLSVKSLRIKRRPVRSRGASGETTAELLDVTFAVSAFEPL